MSQYRDGWWRCELRAGTWATINPMLLSFSWPTLGSYRPSDFIRMNNEMFSPVVWLDKSLGRGCVKSE